MQVEVGEAVVGQSTICSVREKSHIKASSRLPPCVQLSTSIFPSPTLFTSDYLVVKLVLPARYLLYPTLLKSSKMEDAKKEDDFNMAARRLIRDFKSIEDCPPAGISAAPTEDDLLHWEAIVTGPESTPYEGGMFKLDMRFKPSYPVTPPEVKFVSDVFHPNVYPNGKICVDILQHCWMPSLDVSSILQSIQSLLESPNCESPANPNAAKLFKENKIEYKRIVRICVEKSFE